MEWLICFVVAALLFWAVPAYVYADAGWVFHSLKWNAVDRFGVIVYAVFLVWFAVVAASYLEWRN